MKLWYIVGIVLSVISGGFSVWGCGEIYESALGYTWPHVNGKIISSVARSALMKGRRGEFISHWPEVRYEYDVNNLHFLGDRVRFTERGMDEEETKRVVAMYPSGKAVTVYVSPSNANSSVLEQGIWWPLIPILLLSLSLSLSMPALIYFDFKMGRR